ncbi:asparagine synthase (glutamine-hydrolyzing) [Oceanobacillus halophilus]|uniref:asparagine synthase (glutamine-hydrolyzing) n=1 Tax=Oceanobacillus halophilus TaxID=930130 RepID=A0A495A1W2_9BACI|nr:asparagine synthase (glutamine-hydrolyzing) [Oceanobacillus halophilus]RKQ33462.1 asparagine synthase (glutamine-hydrolyzing) [Oceanobacillus halophilus]
MCGFLGVHLNGQLQFSEERLQAIKAAGERINHRGPDDDGFYHDSQTALVFKRLSIIDLEGGHQPFSFGDNRYHLVFNGEIYNYLTIKQQLLEKGYRFHTKTDTEVVANLFLEKGIFGVHELRGMFSFVIWDTMEKKIYGARDPFGIKPFYYMENENEWIVASEKKCISELTQLETLDKEALQHYMSFQYAPEPFTLTKEVKKLPAGHLFVKEQNSSMKIKPYFHASFQPVVASETQMIDCVREVLFDSVQSHLQSDVPVGSFLSGGIDSTLIVAIAKQYHPTIKTFSVGFERDGYSEIDVAKESAEKIGVENISRTITPEEFITELPKVIWHMDDPLADPACVPLYFVAREARKHVKVALSGEGADELFGGYNIYREPHSLRLFQYIPDKMNRALYYLAKLLPNGVKGKSFLERGTTPLEKRYIGNAKIFEEEEKQKLLKQYNPEIPYRTQTMDLYRSVQDIHPVLKMQYIDMHTWLTGDILLKADKMTMANSLEVRVPFLDREVFEVARSIPVDNKIADGTTKAILRKAAEGMVPEHVLHRKKLGFPVPIKYWLKNELYAWAKNIMIQSETNQWINKAVVLSLLEEHAANHKDHARKIWTVLVFMIWHQIYMERVYDFGENTGEKILQPN